MSAADERDGCPLCGSHAVSALCAKFGLDLVRCKGCGLIYADPGLSQAELLKRYDSPAFFDEYLRALHATPSGYDLEFLERHYRLFLDFLQKFQAPGRRLLDAGCGAGFFLKTAEARGWIAEGVEVSAPAAAYARDITGVCVRHGRLEDKLFSGAAFDVVTLLDLIEHLPDPIGAIKETWRLLKPGGILILSTPDFNSLSRFILGKAWAVLSPAEHLINFTEATLSLALSAAGFHIIGIRNLFIFNPEYSHDKSKKAAVRWKRVHARLERKKLMDHIHGFEYLDLMHIGEVKAPHMEGMRFSKRLSRMAYLWAKRWLRGDMLVAAAQKPPLVGR